MDLSGDGLILYTDVLNITTTERQQGHPGVCDLWDVGKHFIWRISTWAVKDIFHNVVRLALLWHLSEKKGSTNTWVTEIPI